MRIKLKYSDTFTLAPGIGSNAVQVFSCNGIFDPDITGVGHQPRGFDEWMAMYDHYVVTGAHIRVRVTTAAGSGDQVFGIALKDSASVHFTPLTDYTETSYTKNLFLQGATNSSSKTLSYSANVGRFLGRKSPMSDPELKGTVLANPVEQMYFHVYANAPFVAGVPSPICCTADITYTVSLIEPKVPGQS